MNRPFLRASFPVVSLALALGVLACGKGKLDPDAMQSTIATALKTRDVTLKSITCPAREVKAGDSFDCDGVTDGDEKVAFKVEQKDDQKNVSISYGHVSNEAHLGSEFAAKFGKGAAIKCPSKTVILKKGVTFSCDATFDNEPSKFEITVKDDKGNIGGKIHTLALAAPAAVGEPGMKGAAGGSVGFKEAAEADIVEAE